MDESRNERPREVAAPAEASQGASEAADSYLQRLRENRTSKSENTDGGDEESEQPQHREIKEGGEPLSEFPELERQVREAVERAREGVERWGPEDQQHARTWLGSSSGEVRDRLRTVLERMDGDIDRVQLVPFEDDMTPEEQANTFAYVYPGDEQRRIHVGALFRDASETPPDSRAGIIVHEMSHFRDIGGTRDVQAAYGEDGSRQLAAAHPEVAQHTADNFEYFVEEYSRSGGPR